MTYVGKITEIIDKDLYTIKVDIPGLIIGDDSCENGALAIPTRNVLDEPKPGDLVLLKEIDPLFGSIFIYTKLKEDTFIGFRSRGKLVSISEDEIDIATFDPEAEYKDDEIPEYQDWIKIDKDGNLNIKMRGTEEIAIDGDCKLQVSGGCTASFLNGLDATVQGTAKINSQKVEITGGQLSTTNGGVCQPSGMGGFCGIPVCPFTGAPHVGNTIMGT